MRRKLLLFVVLLSVVSGGISAQSFTQKVTAQIQPTLQVEWPEAEFNFGQLVVGVNETPVMPLKVLCNVGYTIVLETVNTHLTEFSSELKTYGKNKLKEPLRVSIDGGLNWREVTNSLVLIDKSEGSKEEEVFNLCYQQVMSFPGDMALTEGSFYKTDIFILVTPII